MAKYPTTRPNDFRRPIDQHCLAEPRGDRFWQSLAGCAWVAFYAATCRDLQRQAPDIIGAAVPPEQFLNCVPGVRITPGAPISRIVTRLPFRLRRYCGGRMLKLRRMRKAISPDSQLPWATRPRRVDRFGATSAGALSSYTRWAAGARRGSRGRAGGGRRRGREQAKQVEQESDHRPGLCQDQSRRINTSPAG
jgi:hypothetical protein